MGKTAYNYFVIEKRNQVKEEHPDWKFGDISREVGRMWKELSPEEREPYEKMAEASNLEDPYHPWQTKTATFQTKSIENLKPKKSENFEKREEIEQKQEIKDGEKEIHDKEENKEEEDDENTEDTVNENQKQRHSSTKKKHKKDREHHKKHKDKKNKHKKHHHRHSKIDQNYQQKQNVQNHGFYPYHFLFLPNLMIQQPQNQVMFPLQFPYQPYFGFQPPFYPQQQQQAFQPMFPQMPFYPPFQPMPMFFS